MSKLDIRQIKQCFKIGGEFRAPDYREDGKRFTWDDGLGLFVYEDDIHLSSAARETATNRVEFTLTDGTKKYLSLGALAWENEAGVITSVFGRTTPAITAQTGDYSANQVTNAFDKTVDDLDDISEGATNKHFTSTYKSNVDANTAARHTHSNKTVLDAITNAGGGVIPTALQIATWDAYTGTTQEFIEDTVSVLIKNGTGISWVYNDSLGTLTPTVNLSAFTTDNLPEGSVNKYFSSTTSANVITITLPSASTVAARCAAAVEGDDYPEGWVLSADTSPVDLLIEHNLSRRCAGVSIFSVNGTSDQQLFGNAAYSSIYNLDSANQIRISALATIETEIVIHLLFS